jgi:hypothetical protein
VKHCESRRSSQLILGLLLMLGGTLLFLDRAGIVEIRSLWRYWPVILIGMGLNRLFDTPARRRDGNGLWLLMLGSWFLLNTLGIMTLRDSWPLIIVAIGVSIVRGAVVGNPSRRIEEDRDGK